MSLSILPNIVPNILPPDILPPNIVLNILPPIVPVSVPQLENLVTAVVNPVDPTVTINEATNNAVLINAGTVTEFQFVQQLLQQAAPTTCPVVAVYAAMYGVVSSAAELDMLTTQFEPAQFAFATNIGVADPVLYNYQSLGLALAQASDTGATLFATTWGPANPACPDTPDGNAAFVARAYIAVFGHDGTQGQIDEFIAQINSFTTIYTADPPVPGADADTICLLARGAVFGLMVGVAVENKIGPLFDQVTNFLEDAAQGIAVFGAPLSTQPEHSPFPGEVSLTIGATLTLGADNISVAGNVAIFAPAGTLQTGDIIDVGAGLNILIGGFVDGATPTITNVETLALMADTDGGTLNFNSMTGVQQAFIVGNFSVGDHSTVFANIALGTQVGIENFMGAGNEVGSVDNSSATFTFAGATGVETADLTVSKAGVFTDLENTTHFPGVNVVINKIGTLDLHVAGDSNIDGLVGDSMTKLVIDGSANLRVDTHSGQTPFLAVVDATKLTGKFFFDDDSVTQPGLTVKMGTGPGQVETDASSAERIYMDPNKLATDVYTASSFDNLKAATAAQVTTDAGADLAAVQVFNFIPGRDKIDLADIVVAGFEDHAPGLGCTAASGKIYIATAQQDATAGTLGSVKAAAEYVAANDGSAAARTIDVFEYKGSTYIFDDAHGNNVMHTGPGTTDGLIKLVGTLGVHLTDFV